MLGGLIVVAATLALAGYGAAAVSTGSRPPVQVREAASVSELAASLERQYIRAVRAILPSIVQIRTTSGLGSGIVFDRRGDVVTNAHVTAGSSSFAVTLGDGRQFDGRLVGAYAADDLAVVSIGAHGAKPAVFADSSKLVVGDIVLAAGNPLGLQSSITDGIVSALDRDVSEGGGIVLPGTIQTSAPINPGNSGGALVDLGGRVVGIPTLAAATSTGAAAGIGFAIPSNLVRDIAGQLIRSGHVTNSHRAALGVTIADSFARPGALVVAVQRGGPAARAGIAVGDAIVGVDGTRVSNSETLGTVLAAHRPGDAVEVTLTQTDGKTKTVGVVLGELAAS